MSPESPVPEPPSEPVVPPISPEAETEKTAEPALPVGETTGDMQDEPPEVLPVESVLPVQARAHRQPPPRQPDFWDAVVRILLQRPHPGFWWSILWCVGALFVTQFLVSVVILIGVIVLEMLQGESLRDILFRLESQDKWPAFLMPMLVATSQVCLVLMGMVALRLIAGKDWTRQVALRLPSAVHVVLAIVAVPAMSLTADLCYKVEKGFLPGFEALPTYFVTTVTVLALLSALWGVIRLATGKNCLRELARMSLGSQLALVAVTGVAVIGLSCLLMVGLRPIDEWVFECWPSLSSLTNKNLMEEFVKQSHEWPLTAAVLIIGLGPGVGEEMWCRAFLGRGLVGRYGVVLGVVMTSLFFGWMHLDPHQGTMAVFMGLALYYAYLMTRSLLIPMLIHFLHNSLSVLLDRLPPEWEPVMKPLETGTDTIQVQFIFVAAALLLAAVGWALYSSRARLVRSAGSPEPPWQLPFLPEEAELEREFARVESSPQPLWQPPFPGVAYPPPGSGTVVVHPLPHWLPTLAVVAGVIALGFALVWALMPSLLA